MDLTAYSSGRRADCDDCGRGDGSRRVFSRRRVGRVLLLRPGIHGGSKKQDAPYAVDTEPPRSKLARGHDVELVEHVVTTNSERFALNFEIPAILHGASVQVTPHGHFTFAIGALSSSQAFTTSLKLTNERFERTADALKGGRSLFVELAQ